MWLKVILLSLISITLNATVIENHLEYKYRAWGIGGNDASSKTYLNVDNKNYYISTF